MAKTGELQVVALEYSKIKVITIIVKPVVSFLLAITILILINSDTLHLHSTVQGANLQVVQALTGVTTPVHKAAECLAATTAITIIPVLDYMVITQAQAVACSVVITRQIPTTLAAVYLEIIAIQQLKVVVHLVETIHLVLVVSLGVVPIRLVRVLEEEAYLVGIIIVTLVAACSVITRLIIIPTTLVEVYLVIIPITIVHLEEAAYLEGATPNPPPLVEVVAFLVITKQTIKIIVEAYSATTQQITTTAPQPV